MASSGTKATIHKIERFQECKEDTKEMLALFCVLTRAAMIYHFVINFTVFFPFKPQGKKCLFVC